jgi:hypothetical protein
MFRGLFGKKPVPLTGAPTTRRVKTYSAQSGYVYRYFYLGHRKTETQRQAGTEYVFEVAADAKSSLKVSVFVMDGGVAEWERSKGRELAVNERYAVAKLALFRAFDERLTPQEMADPVYARVAEVAEILEELGID